MKKGSPVIIIIFAIAIVAVVSFLPLSKWSGGHIKNFSLVSDILKETGTFLGDTFGLVDENIDPELIKAQEDADLKKSDSIPKSGEQIDTIISPIKPSRVGELVKIEDYTTTECGFYNFKAALDSGRLARVAVVGDSYIEGDIFTQDLRNYFQEVYGGEGVGYVNMHSDFPGFRRSVKQSGDGWTSFTLNKKADKEYIDLAGQYFKPAGGVATSVYEGSKSFATTGAWSHSRFLFISPDDASISIKSGDAEWECLDIIGSPDVQCIDIAQPLSKFGVKTSASSLVGLGVWLDGESGVSLDCMSIRGFSGITLTKVNPDLSHKMAEFIKYDLIILEFGINAMSSQQKNYSVYCSRMVDVINHIRLCYPDSDILLMGVGDRGEKVGSQIKSMATSTAMISAQRDAARRAHCLFWDTREAMGGENAVVEWASAGDMTKDYVHLTHKGGARLARELFNSIQSDLE